MFSSLRKKQRANKIKVAVVAAIVVAVAVVAVVVVAVVAVVVAVVVVVVVVVLVVVVFPASKRHNEISTWHVFSNGSTCGHVGMGNSSAHLPLLSKNTKECSTTWQTKQKKKAAN